MAQPLKNQQSIRVIREEVDRIEWALKEILPTKLFGQAAIGIALSIAPDTSRDAERAKLHDAARKT